MGSGLAARLPAPRRLVTRLLPTKEEPEDIAERSGNSGWAEFEDRLLAAAAPAKLAVRLMGRLAGIAVAGKALANDDSVDVAGRFTGCE